jgi:FMN reductase
VAAAVADAVFGGDVAISLVELADLAPGLLGWGDEQVAAAKQQVLDSDLLVVASPVYKASITGMLKAFLDQFGRDELAAKATVPVMVGASTGHALAVEHQLRPVLVEIGACCPTRGLYIVESELDQLSRVIDDWLTVWGTALRAVVGAASARVLPSSAATRSTSTSAPTASPVTAMHVRAGSGGLNQCE